MRQVVQRPRDGSVSIVEVSEPTVSPGWVLVDVRCSLISAGTERAKIETGSKNLLQKAKARPDLARTVIQDARAHGVRATAAKVKDRLDAASPIGYSCSGIVRAVGEGVPGLAPGLRVACGGAGWANHAEVVRVPKNLVAALPDSVSFEAGSYATVGAIALHAVRQSEAAVGEVVGVIGLGLVGQLATRILAAAGCRVVGVDLDQRANDLASAGGAVTYMPDAARLDQAVRDLSSGAGLDAVLICAGTRSSEPLALATALARDRGRIVVVGDVPIASERHVLYEKELDIRLSRSYGAGRYDVDYEERGHDLPIGYVRWTEQRNLSAFLDLIAAGRLATDSLTTHRFPIERASEAYATLSAGPERAFGVVLEYPGAPPEPVLAPRRAALKRGGGPRVGFVGAGNFARATLVPAFAAAGARLVAVASQGGVSAADTAARLGFERACSADDLIEAGDLDAVVIATRHSEHATLTAEALRAGKHVFVEKPLAINSDGVDEVEASLESGTLLMVGFNRRYSPLVVRLRDDLQGTRGKVLIARVNASGRPADHWLHDPVDGGGTMIGEGCHFVDLLTHLAGSRVERVHAFAAPQPGRDIGASDSFVATFRFADGSVGSLIYASGGDARSGKERIEVFGGGISAAIDDFRRLEIRGPKSATLRGRPDKGHRAEIAAFVAATQGHAAAPDATSYLRSTRATLAVVESLRTGAPVDL